MYQYCGSLAIDQIFTVDDWTQQELKSFCTEFKGKNQPSKKDDPENKFSFYDEVMNREDNQDILKIPNNNEEEEDQGEHSPRSAEMLAY